VALLIIREDSYRHSAVTGSKNKKAKRKEV
jgi:hypothetical protein